jgi:hypothetical protein
MKDPRPIAPSDRPLAMGVGEYVVRALAGVVLGTLLGGMAMGFVANLLAFAGVSQPSDALQLRAACGLGLVGAVWLVQRGPRQRWRGAQSPAARRSRAEGLRHGWVDAVFRLGIGAAWGAFALPCAAMAAFVWFVAFGGRDRAVDVFGSLFGYGLGLSIPAGALLGALWFALDLPWFRRRTADGVAAAAAPAGNPRATA